VRSVANYSSPLMPAEEGTLDEAEILLRLTGIVTGQGPEADTEGIDRFVIETLVRREVADEHSRIAGRDPAEIVELLEPRQGAERALDFMLRTGPYGEGFGTDPDGLSLDVLERNPHGVDLGPLRPRVPEALRTPSGEIELAPEPIAEDVERLRQSLERPNGHMVLVGRRQLRSNNSWMHNLPVLVKGKDRCTMHVSPKDADRLGLADGGRARVRSRTGELIAPVEVTDAVMPGVVSIPHGWGHGVPGARMGVASEHAGVNSNLLADESVVDPLSGNAVLNGIPVEIAPA
jgi:anaerobic selenocysteine-containing dehydrogenase